MNNGTSSPDEARTERIRELHELSEGEYVYLPENDETLKVTNVSYRPVAAIDVFLEQRYRIRQHTDGSITLHPREGQTMIDPYIEVYRLS